MDNFIFEIPNAISKEFCQEIIDRFERDNNKKLGCISGFGEVQVPEQKKSVDLFISDLEEWNDIDKKIHECVGNSVSSYFKFLNETFNCNQKIHPLFGVLNHDELDDSGYNISKQEKGCDYKWHYDGFDKSACFIKDKNIPFLRVLIYLSDLSYEDGGSTLFWGGKRIVPETGKVLVFPTTWTFVHSSEQIKTDKFKYTCMATVHAV